jgi:hypothetical protein
MSCQMPMSASCATYERVTEYKRVGRRRGRRVRIPFYFEAVGLEGAKLK